MMPNAGEEKMSREKVEVSSVEAGAGTSQSPRVAPQQPRYPLPPGKVMREPRKYRHAPFDIANRRQPVARTSGFKNRPPLANTGGPNMTQRDSWQSWSELTVRIAGIQNTTTTWDLWKRFEANGTVVLIEIFETRQGTREGTAKIRFSPPPLRDFWSIGSITIPSADGRSDVTVQIELEPKKRSFEVRSPIRPGVWYPERMSSYPSAITFGFMYEKTVMMGMRRVLDGWKNIKFDVDLLRNRLVVKFESTLIDPQVDLQKAKAEPNVDSRMRSYMFTIPFEKVQKIDRVELNDSRWALLLSLDGPPQFFQKRRDSIASHSSEALLWSDFDTWYRLTDIVQEAAALDKTPVGLRKELPFIDIGRWTTYYFSFDKDRNSQRIISQMRMALTDYNIKVCRLENFSMIPGRPAEFWPLIDPPTSQLNEATSLNEDCTLPFQVRYQLEVCISQGVLQEHNITRDFVKKLAMTARDDPTSARNLLEYVADQEIRIYDPMTIFDDAAARAHSPKAKIPDYCTYTRKLTITPTTIYYSSPSVETTNRVIRKYMEHYGDRFLRVQFTDEKSSGRIHSCADKARNDRLFARVWRTLSNGIQMGDRKYEFLAFGNSQFRENGAYFFCPTPQLKGHDIRRWMGDFTDIKVVAKYAARLGLCFSTTRAIQNSGVKKVMIEDVMINGHCFTDGVGKISTLLATMIADELKLSAQNQAPSAFQFRFGGAKGVLVAWPDVKGREVHIRPSQDKFPSVSNSLEIIRSSHYSPATLNRQTITILSSLGVPDDVFNKMITEQLADYQAAMDDSATALDCLGRYVDENHMTINIAAMIENGFMDVKEPFVLSLLHLWRAWSIKLLKEKARLIVENGACLLGVTDETCTLRGQKAGSTMPGAQINLEELPEIFVQVPDKNKKGCYVVIQGLCLVGRNPSLFPGDIRVVQAVNQPSLHHLRDVVVFSQQGARDIPSMCSGGDLDGDDFFCIWDKNLTPAEWNAVPMSYEAPKPAELDRPVRIDDVMRFFVRYMKNDTLPVIAQAHLALSDYLDRGIKDPKCLELAMLHSKAVDYVKTGDAAEMPRRLRPRMIPHFMDKSRRPKEQVYKSKKILGQLYDKVDSVNFTPQFNAPFDERILKSCPIDDKLLSSVREIKYKYDKAVRQIMNQLEINTEFEVWSTFVLSSRRVGSDYKLQEDMAVITGALKDRFRKICVEAAGADGGNDFENMRSFVAAMYKVTEEEMRVALAECSAMKMVRGVEVPKRRMEPKYMPLMSFPWLFDGILGKIVRRTSSVGMLSPVTPSEVKSATIADDLNTGIPSSSSLPSWKLRDVADYLNEEIMPSESMLSEWKSAEVADDQNTETPSTSTQLRGHLMEIADLLKDERSSESILSRSKSAKVADVPHVGTLPEPTKPRAVGDQFPRSSPVNAFRLPRPDSLDSEDEGDEALYGYDSLLAPAKSRHDSARDTVTYVQKHALPFKSDGAIVPKLSPDEGIHPLKRVLNSKLDGSKAAFQPSSAAFKDSIGPDLFERATPSPSGSNVGNPASTAFLSFANAESSTMRDLALLEMGPRLVSSGQEHSTGNGSRTYESLFDFTGLSSSETFGSTTAGAAERTAEDEEVVRLELEESLLERLEGLNTS